MEAKEPPIEGRNPFLGMEVEDLADRLQLVESQMQQTSSSMLMGALEKNRAWLREALTVELFWNMSQGNE